MSLSSSSASSLPSSQSHSHVSMTSGVASSRHNSSYPAPAPGGAAIAAAATPPPAAAAAAAGNATAANVPVWRSVGEKSALRGYLAVLGVTPEASLADIRRAYSKLALQWHPDRSDAPNARLKFQEISAAYFALATSEEAGDAQDIDVALYEKGQQAQQSQQQQLQSQGSKGADAFAAGLAGVTAGLAGVFSSALGANNGSFSPYLALPQHKSTCNSLMHPSHAFDLYPNAAAQQGKHHPLHCACHATSNAAHSNLHAHPPACQCHAHAHSHSHSHTHSHAHPHSPHTHSKLLDPAATGGVTISELDVGLAAQADVAHSGVLPPPLIAVGDNSVQISIHPLAHAAVPVVYQVQIKIKKTYQLVYQGTALTYTVPNLVSGTRYQFRVRACPAALNSGALGVTSGRGGSGGSSSVALDSDDDLTDGLLDEIVADEASGLGVYSQPVSVTTQGTKPEGNAPHPPVLSNLQLAALKKKGKKKGQQKSANGAAHAHDKDESDDDKSTTTKASRPQQQAAQLKKGAASVAAEDDVDTEPNSLASTPKRSESRTLTRDSSSDNLAKESVAAPAATTSAAAAAAASSSLAKAPSKAPLSKKEQKELKKAQEDERRRIELETAAARKLEEEVLYQKFIMERRLEAERVRLEEEQRELEKYARLKTEQDEARRKQDEEQKRAAKQAAEEESAAARAGKRGGKKGTAAQQAAQSAPLLPTPQVRTKGKQGAAGVSAAANAAPIVHIKMKGAGATPSTPLKDGAALLPTPSSHLAAAAARPKAVVAHASPAAKPASPLLAAKTPAWSLPAPALATPPPKTRESVTHTPHATTAAVASAATPAAVPSPIIKSKPGPGGKAWTNVVTPATSSPAPAAAAAAVSPPTHAAHVSSVPLSLSSHSPSFVPSSSLSSRLTANDSLLSEHLGRFDATKPWQSDAALMQMQQQREHSHLLLQQAQQQQQQQSSQSQSHSLDPSSRFHSLSPFSSSHSLLPSVGSSSVVDSSSSAWPDSDDALDDLQQAIERERWDAAAAAQWNSTANTTLHTSSTATSGLHFAPLSSLRSDPFLSDSVGVVPSLSSHRASSLGGEHDGIFMSPTRQASSGNAPGSFFTSSASRSADALGPALGSTSSYQLAANSFASSVGSSGMHGSSDVGSSLHSYSTLQGFPSASGLSRDAPTFNPSAVLQDDSVSSSLGSSASLNGHTRLPLPSVSSSLSVAPSPAVTGGLFTGGFALPSFSSFSSTFGAPSVSSGSGSGALSSSDWSGAPVAHAAGVHALVDDDADLFSSVHSGLPSLSSQLHADDDVILAGGSGAGVSSLGSSWLNRNSLPIQHSFQSMTE